jgi:hypothetical protein
MARAKALGYFFETNVALHLSGDLLVRSDIMIKRSDGCVMKMSSLWVEFVCIY